jgi:hypothetical protein
LLTPDGALSRWYKELNADWKALSKTLLVSVFEDSQYKSFLNPQNLDVKKLNKSLLLHLNELTDAFRSENDAYTTRIDKSLLQIIAEENCENALAHLKRFDYPFIKLTTPHSVSKKVYAGYQIENNAEVVQQIGYDPNQFNDIMLDSLQFKHKIVKIVFFHKLSFSDYFNFESLGADFQNNFAELKKEKKIVSSPFIHKELAGPKFDGDNYSVLNSASKTTLNKSFNELNDEKKQVVLKYGLVFFEKFVKAAKAAGILNTAFEDTIVQFNTSDSSIQYGKVEFDNFLGEYDIVAGNTTIKVSEQVSVQGHKSKVSELFDYLKANINDNARLDAAATLNCHKESYKTIVKLLDKAILAEVLEGFVDLRNSTIKSDFLEYFISVMS